MKLQFLHQKNTQMQHTTTSPSSSHSVLEEFQFDRNEGYGFPNTAVTLFFKPRLSLP